MADYFRSLLHGQKQGGGLGGENRTGSKPPTQRHKGRGGEGKWTHMCSPISPPGGHPDLLDGQRLLQASLEATPENNEQEAASCEGALWKRENHTESEDGPDLSVSSLGAWSPTGTNHHQLRAECLGLCNLPPSHHRPLSSGNGGARALVPVERDSLSRSRCSMCPSWPPLCSVNDFPRKENTVVVNYCICDPRDTGYTRCEFPPASPLSVVM